MKEGGGISRFPCLNPYACCGHCFSDGVSIARNKEGAVGKRCSSEKAKARDVDSSIGTFPNKEKSGSSNGASCAASITRKEPFSQIGPFFLSL